MEPCEGDVSIVISRGPEPTVTATSTEEPTETPASTEEPTPTPTPDESADTTEVSPTLDSVPPTLPAEVAADQSEAFEIDLEIYDVGDLADELGTDLVIAERGGRKHLTGYTDLGRLEIGSLSLSSNFEVVLEADWGDFSQNVMLRSSTGEELAIRFENRDISFGNTELRYSRTNWEGGDAINVIRLTVTNDTAKLYINDEFFGTAVVDPSLTYNEFIISGIKRDDALYSVTLIQKE
jgi:hypothetical protein